MPSVSMEYVNRIFKELAGQIDGLTTRTETVALRKRVGELEVTIEVLVELLAHAHGLDRKALLETVRGRQAAKPIDVENPEPRDEGEVTCTLCHRAVSAARTVMTGNGVICDPQCPR